MILGPVLSLRCHVAKIEKVKEKGKVERTVARVCGVGREEKKGKRTTNNNLFIRIFHNQALNPCFDV